MQTSQALHSLGFGGVNRSGERSFKIMAKKLNLIGVFVAGLIFTSTMSGCGEVGCNPAHDSWCEEKSSSSEALLSSSDAKPSSSSETIEQSSSSSSSSSSLAPSSSSFAHSGKGNNISNYRTVVIGTQTWMAENLDYVVEGSKCYNNDPANCEIYGSLYNWSTAMALPSICNSSTCSNQIQSKHRGICPIGWHIPNDDDWNVLMDYVGGSSVAGTKLKSTSGWYNNGNGTDDYGFSALPGGIGSSDGYFGSVGDYGYWWSTSEDSDYAYLRGMYYDGDSADGYGYKSALFSVRCIKD